MPTESLCKIDELIQLFDKEIDYSSFILSMFIKDCYSEYPMNFESMQNLRKYYLLQNKSIDIKQIVPIINLLKQTNNRSKLVCVGFIRQFRTDNVIPMDIIDLIDSICALKCISALRDEGFSLLTDIIMTPKYLSRNSIKCFIENGIIGLLHKSFNKLVSFQVKCAALYSLYRISVTYTEFRPGILKNHILKCTKRIRRFLSRTIPPAKEIAESKIIPLFIALAGFSNYPELQYASVGVLNIAARPSECTENFVHYYHARDLLISLLKSPLYEIKEQSMWGLANFAGDSPVAKDILFHTDILKNIFEICSLNFQEQFVTNFTNSSLISHNPFSQFITLLESAAWALSNLCRHSYPTTCEMFITFIKNWRVLVKCLQCLLKRTINIDYKHDITKNEPNHKDETLAHIACAFSHLVTYEPFHTDMLQLMEADGTIQQFVSLMDYKSSKVRRSVNRTFGELLTGSDQITKKLLNLGILDKYERVLLNAKNDEEIKKETCWSISNICAGPTEDKLLVIERLFPLLISLLKDINSPTGIRKEVLWAICNAASDNNEIVICALVDLDVIGALQIFLQTMQPIERDDEKLLMIALECIDNILIVGQYKPTDGQRSVNRFANEIKEKEIMQYIQKLQNEGCQEMSDSIIYAKEIIKNHEDSIV